MVWFQNIKTKKGRIDNHLVFKVRKDFNDNSIFDNMDTSIIAVSEIGLDKVFVFHVGFNSFINSNSATIVSNEILSEKVTIKNTIKVQIRREIKKVITIVNVVDGMVANFNMAGKVLLNYIEVFHGNSVDFYFINVDYVINDVEVVLVLFRGIYGDNFVYDFDFVLMKQNMIVVVLNQVIKKEAGNIVPDFLEAKNYVNVVENEEGTI